MKKLAALFLILCTNFAAADDRELKAGHPMCLTSDDLYQIVKAAREGDRNAVEHLTNSGRCIAATGGEEITVIKNAVSGPMKVRVYLYDGEAFELWVYPFSLNG